MIGRSAQLILPGDAYWWDTPRFRGEGYAGETNVAYMKRLKQWKSKAPLPILWEDLPADATFPASLGRIDDEVLSTKVMTWHELLDVFEPEELGKLLPPVGERHQNVTVGVYANREWVAWSVLAQSRSGGILSWRGSYPDQIIRKIEHKMGRCPIRITSGLTGTWKSPGVFWKGLLYTVRDMIEQVDARFSEAATSSKFSAIPWLKYWRQTKDEDITPAAVQAAIQKEMSGDVITLDPGDDQEGREDIEVLKFPPLGPGIDLGQFQLDLIRRLTGATDAIEGLPGPSGGNLSTSMSSRPSWSSPGSKVITSPDISFWMAACTAAGVMSSSLVWRQYLSQGIAENFDEVAASEKRASTCSIMSRTT